MNTSHGLLATVQFCQISPEELQVDHSYQREFQTSRRWLKMIGDNFEPLAFGALIVGERKDGSRFIIDGQHRWRIALDRKEPFVPCMIAKTTKEDEARIFRLIQINRTNLSAAEKFRAGIICQDELVCGVAEILDDLGIEICLNKSGHVRWPKIGCVGAVMTIASTTSLQHLRNTLQIVRDTWADSPPNTGADDKMHRNEIILGVSQLLKKAKIDGRRFVDVMSEISCDAVINATVLPPGGNRQQAIATTLAKFYNARTGMDCNFPMTDQK